MAEPIFITAGSLVVVCGKVISTITNFVRDVRGARKDLMTVCDELSSLRMTLEALCDDCNDPKVKIPPNLEDSLSTIMRNCNKTVGEIDGILATMLGGGMRGKIEWTTRAKEDVGRMRVNLEAHKTSLGLILDMIDMAITRDIKSDTTEIKATTEVIQTEIRDGHAKILEKIETLRVGVATKTTTKTKLSSSSLPELPELPDTSKSRATVAERKEVTRHEATTENDREALNKELWKLLGEMNEPENNFRIESSEYVEALRSILQQGANPNTTDEVHFPRRKWTPLHEASFSGSPQVVDILLEFGADANAADNRQRTPLHMCCGLHQVESLERIARSLIKTGGANVNAKNYHGATPLLTMSYLDNSINLLRQFIDVGADVNAANNEGCVPLTRAIAYGSTNNVSLLMERGADIYVRDLKGRSVLEVARQDLECGMVGDGMECQVKPEMLNLLKPFGLHLFQG